MKFYIAGRYKDRQKLKDFSEQLLAAGYDVTSTWLDETYPPEVTMAEVSIQELRNFAVIDVSDIKRADAIVLFTQSDTEPTYRNGRLVEFGIALGMGKQLYIIGPKENIFMYLPRVAAYASIDEFLSKPHYVPEFTYHV